MTTANVSFGSTIKRASLTTNAVRLADTAANRTALQTQAAKDRRPSALVDLGQDIVLISAAALETRSRLARTTGATLGQGDKVSVDGVEGTVLSSDDGLAEIDASHVVVAVIDSGLDVNHPAFAGRIVNPHNIVTGTDDVTDKVGHGTHVAGIIAGADSVQSVGVAPNVKIMPIKTTNNDRGSFSTADIAKAIRYAADNGANVINLSLGGNWPLPSMREAMEYAESKGVVIVAASGNSNKKSVAYPARYETAVSVGSSKDGKRSSFSNRGRDLDVSAPGEKINSAKPGGGYQLMSGTSMASPYAAGAAALAIAQHPDWTVAQVKEHLNRAVNDLGAPGWDADFGYGEVNLFKVAFGNDLPAIPRAPEPPKTWWQKILSFFGF